MAFRGIRLQIGVCGWRRTGGRNEHAREGKPTPWWWRPRTELQMRKAHPEVVKAGHAVCRLLRGVPGGSRRLPQSLGRKRVNKE